MAAPSEDAPFQLYTAVRYATDLAQVPNTAAYAHAGWNYRHASPFYMLDFHRDRLLRAATFWGWPAAVDVVSGEAGLRAIERVLIEAVQQNPESAGGTLRCRLILDRDGRLGCETAAAPEAALVGLLPPRLPPPGYMQGGGDGGKEQGQDGLEEEELPPLLPSLRAVMGQAPYEVTLDVNTTDSSAYTHYKTTRRQMYDEARRRAGITGPERKEVLLVNAGSGVIMDGSVSTVYFWRGGRWVTPPVPLKYGSNNGSGGLDGTTRRWALER